MNTKNIIIVLVLLIISIGLTNARADVIKDGLTEAKYEMKEFNEETVPAVVADVKALPDKGKKFWNKEVEKTKEFQKQGWEDAKKQTADTVNKIKKFFSGSMKKAD
jgi:F0F1-type ATP synthase membrane subunit b/b'